MSDEFLHITKALNGKRVIYPNLIHYMDKKYEDNEILLHYGDPNDPSDPRWQVISKDDAIDIMNNLIEHFSNLKQEIKRNTIKTRPEFVEYPVWWKAGNGMMYNRNALDPSHPESPYHYIKRTYRVCPEDYGIEAPTKYHIYDNRIKKK
jgi:hypothetical protein